MDWRDNLKETVGVTDEKNIVDLTDMEERELLGREHLDYETLLAVYCNMGTMGKLIQTAEELM